MRSEHGFFFQGDGKGAWGISLPDFGGGGDNGVAEAGTEKMEDNMRLSLQKEESLLAALRGKRSLLVAFSGGVDSTYLLRSARLVLGENVQAAIGTGVSFQHDEVQAAASLADLLGVPLHTVPQNPFSVEAFRENRVDRCYHCKKAMFADFVELARSLGVDAIVDGENADDAQAYRPGRLAAMELGIGHPLAEVELGKEEIRLLSARAGLPTAGKPSQPCLATRFPYDTLLTPEKLARVENGEKFLQEMGLKQYRLRDHGDTARIEMDPADFGVLLDAPVRQVLVSRFKALGYRFVTVDLEGYRSGCFDPADEKNETAAEREATWHWSPLDSSTVSSGRSKPQ